MFKQLFIFVFSSSHSDFTQEREEVKQRCLEKKIQKQMDLIKFALNELGCEELPSGCDLSMEGSFTDTLPHKGV